MEEKTFSSGALALFLLTIGCAHQPISGPLSEDDYRLSYEDERDNHRFRIDLISTSDARICMHEGAWPGRQGMLHFAAEHVYVVVNAHRYPIADHNIGLCVNPPCLVRVPQRGRLTAYIPYSEFDLPEDVYAVEKQLVYRARPVAC